MQMDLRRYSLIFGILLAALLAPWLPVATAALVEEPPAAVEADDETPPAEEENAAEEEPSATEEEPPPELTDAEEPAEPAEADADEAGELEPVPSDAMPDEYEPTEAPLEPEPVSAEPAAATAAEEPTEAPLEVEPAPLTAEDAQAEEAEPQAAEEEPAPPAKKPPTKKSPAKPLAAKSKKRPVKVITPGVPARLPPAASGDAAPLKSKKPQRPVIDAASLNGVHPGVTTRQQMNELWGTPDRIEKIAGGARETYTLEKLGKVRVTIVEGVVESLAIQVERAVEVSAMARRLQIDDVEPVDVLDEQGEQMGVAFPERGVLFGFAPRSNPRGSQASQLPHVSQVIVEPIDAQPFLARAEARLATRYADCRADLDQVLKLMPNNARAHHLAGELSLSTGDLSRAQKSAQKAFDLEPAVREHRLLIARILAESGEYPKALQHARDVADDAESSTIVAARAHCLMGDFLARSSQRDFAEAIKHHQRAIQLAEPLMSDADFVVRRAAKELLLDAHLAVAYDIGWGRWQQKPKVVPKWIERATAFADDLLSREHGRPELQLHVQAGALAALAGIANPPDAGPWVRGLQTLGKKMYEEAEDPGYKAQLAWQLARAMNNAVDIEAARQRPQEALALGEVALALFDESQPSAGKLPLHNFTRGRLCYRIGAVYAIAESDHAQAVSWFDKAAPLMESPVPIDAVDHGSQGEAFVSMAVSYWEQQNRDEALRLTSQGVKLMEQAVTDGTLDRASLAVPYGNLANMHAELGDKEQAEKCSELAARYEADSTTK